MTKFWFNYIWTNCLSFPESGSTSLLKNVQKIKSTIFKRPQYLFLSSSKLQNHFLRRFLLRNFDLISFWCFGLLSQLCCSKIWKKSKKCHFQRSRTFLIELEEASKSFSKIIFRTIFWFKQFQMLCLTFTKKWFQLGHWKICKKKSEKCDFQMLRTFSSF